MRKKAKIVIVIKQKACYRRRGPSKRTIKQECWRTHPENLGLLNGKKQCVFETKRLLNWKLSNVAGVSGLEKSVF